MILFLKGPFETLNYFIDCMEEGRSDSVCLDVSNEQEFFQQINLLNDQIDESTTVILFNNIGLRFIVGEEQRNYWDIKKCMVYNILVDHPVNYVKYFSESYPRVHFITIDACHKEFMQVNFPKLSDNVFFMPHGGKNLGFYKNDERTVDLLYLGWCQEDNQTFPEIDFLKGKEVDFYLFCYQLYASESYLQVDHIVDLYLHQTDMLCSEEQRMSLISTISIWIERKAMHDMKMKLMENLAEAGMHIEIHGANWEKLKNEFPEQITLGEKLTPRECIEQMGHAKITINMQPFFTAGAHERIFNAMLNGSVCVSNRSRYLEQRFQDGQDILFIDFQNIDETVRKIKMLLENQALMRDMRKNAFEKVQKDTWSMRLEQILSHGYDD